MQYEGGPCENNSAVWDGGKHSNKRITKEELRVKKIAQPEEILTSSSPCLSIFHCNVEDEAEEEEY